MNTLDALFPKIRQEILAATMLAPERWWYMADLAKHMGRQSSSLQRELESLSGAEILVSKREGNRVYFRANREVPLFIDLRGLFVKTIGLVDILRDALAPHKERIAAAFVYGSMARGNADAESDIDLMIIGTVRSSALAPALSDAEKQLARPVNVTVFSESEFAAKRKVGHHLIRSVLDGPKLFVVGKENELGVAAKRRKGRRSQGHKV